MFKSIAGRTIDVTVEAGLRKFIPFTSPLLEQRLTFSTAPAQSTICVRPDVYCGKAKDLISTVNPLETSRQRAQRLQENAMKSKKIAEKRKLAKGQSTADNGKKILVDSILTKNEKKIANTLISGAVTFSDQFLKDKSEKLDRDMQAIADRVAALNIDINAKTIVQNILSMTNDPQTADKLVTKAIKSAWLPLPKVDPEPTDVPIEKSIDYFWVKQVDAKQIVQINPQLIVKKRENKTRTTLHKIYQVYDNLEGPTTLHRGKLIPRNEDAQTQFYQSLAGAIVCDQNTGERVFNHEYDHKSFDNLIGALCTRQLGSLVEPDDAHIDPFKDMVGRWMDSWVPNFVEEWLPTNAFDYIENQESFSRDKKLKYIRGMVRFLLDVNHNDYVGKFKPFVKSGEVYEHTQEQAETDDGYNNKTPDRPRLICPATFSGTSVLPAFQSTIFAPLKKVLPEFIHSATSDDIIQNVTERIQPDFKSISIDGSGYDSSQFAVLQDIVDNELFRRIQPQVSQWCYHQCEGLDNHRDPEELTQSLMKSLLQTIYTLYINVPGLNDDEWSPEEINEYRRETFDQQERPYENIARLEINGTTFSGLSTRTTLGNTLRSIAYMYYYIELAGVQNPWESSQVCVIASGDDTVCWCAPDLVDDITQSILKMTARDKSRQTVGLGQVVSEVQTGDFWEVDFCSKKSATLDGTLSTWRMFRNLRKVLTKKQYTNSRNLTYLYRPEVYLGALLYSLRLEKLSSLVECLRQASLLKLTGGKELNEKLLFDACKKHVYTLKHHSSADYAMEEIINYDLGITTETLYKLAADNKIYCGPDRTFELSPERQLKFDAAKQFRYRNCKICDPIKSFKPKPHQPHTHDDYIESCLVTITNEIQVALNFFAGYQPELHCIVDNEADLGYANALIIYIPHTRRVLLFYGPTVHYDQFYVYERLDKLGATCYSWGSVLEADYPNLIDFQARHALLNNTPNFQGMGLSNAAKKLGLPQKISNDDYAAYTENTLDRVSIHYAVRDVLLPEIVGQAFAPADGYARVVRCAQMDYKLPPHIARDWPFELTDVTWCKSP